MTYLVLGGVKIRFPLHDTLNHHKKIHREWIATDHKKRSPEKEILDF